MEVVGVAWELIRVRKGRDFKNMKNLPLVTLNLPQDNCRFHHVSKHFPIAIWGFGAYCQPMCILLCYAHIG